MSRMAFGNFGVVFHKKMENMVVYHQGGDNITNIMWIIGACMGISRLFLEILWISFEIVGFYCGITRYILS